MGVLLVQLSVAMVVVMTVVAGGLAAPGEQLKNTEDFEFVEERPPSSPSGSSAGTRTWLLDPANALCGLLRCGSREVCLLQDRFTAVCVDKAEVARSGDRVVPLQKSYPPFVDNAPPSKGGAASNSNNKNNNNNKPYYMSDEDSGYAFGDNDDDDDFDEDDEDDDEYNYDDEDEDDDENEGDNDDDDDDKSFVEKEGNVTEGSSMTSSSSAAAVASSSSSSSSSSQSPQLDRQPFASKNCGGCPLSRPVFLCGTDNRTYSSTCRLQFHNCIHQAKVEVACKGFCPCKESGRRSSRRNKNSLMAKVRATQQRQQARDNTDNKHRDESDVVTQHRANKYNNNSKKYRKYNKNGQHKKGKFANTRINEVLETPSNNVWGPNECSQDALAAMGNRMLDWFSVIMSDTRAGAQHQAKGGRAPSWCKHEVAWMLGHLDSDGSNQLETRELFQLEHDDRERCIKPFLDRCDLDRDGRLSSREWCKCFDKSERPCAALRTASQGLLGGYIPECDSEGWYRPVQCQGSGGLCWCVDRHGVELTHTRTHGKPRCDVVTQSRSMSSRIDTDDDGDDDSDETVIEGSADMPLDI